ncbi:hypothetical protein GC175_17650 [bacterium]|nr:hypothetical protein [bacterium]
MRKKSPQVKDQGISIVNDVDTWLRLSGFDFNPFTALDAATDQHLHRYLVQHEVFKLIWEDRPVLIFEPRGGGKTALRLQILQNCYVGQETNRPFPISYLPPYLTWGHVAPSATEHLSAILEAAARQLLISFVYRPHWFLQLEIDQRRLVRMLLDIDLPAPVEQYLNNIHTLSDLERLCRRLDLPLFIRIQPDIEPLTDMLHALRTTSPAPTLASTENRWQLVQDLLLSALRMPAIYLLIDGLDAAPETVTHSGTLANVCDFIWQNGADWNERRIFVKAFLPNETKDSMYQCYPEWMAFANITAVNWNEELLVKMLTQRIHAATKGEFQSFNILAAPDFDLVEREIVVSAPRQLPRDVLFLTSEFLHSHVQRVKRQGIRLQMQDLEKAKRSLQEEYV